ncbi:hypothetical protein [Streptomyces lanatus]|uniref:Uncharacterized protein n=1 Tax=Streptomyces lanatus TaxID=66900 RepID=A0ABV1XLG2_9ACTN|nr:hypothetical protein [Streptomyces lanatus]GHG98973.1 hypothetical protein GCM10018780_25300 [Streptomyces lanatus]
MVAATLAVFGAPSVSGEEFSEALPRVTDVRPSPGSGLREGELPTPAPAAEHPLAHAIVAAGRECGLDLPAAEGLTSVPAVGVRVVADSRTVDVLEESGRTVVLVLVDGQPAGALATLMGAAHLAAEAGIQDVCAGLLPQDEMSAVKELEGNGCKVMVIEGRVHDAPALATAHIRVAMGQPNLVIARCPSPASSPGPARHPAAAARRRGPRGSEGPAPAAGSGVEPGRDRTDRFTG